MKLFKRYKEYRARRRFEARRNHAMFRASNGEHLPRLEREELNLPDWTS